MSGAQSSSECALTIAPSLKKTWTDFSRGMCCSVIGGSKLLTFRKPANISSGICACLDVSSLLLCVCFCLDACKPQQIGAQSGLDWSMANLKINLISDTNSHPCTLRHVFQHCVNPVLKHAHYFRRKPKLALYHFFLATLRRQTLKYDLKPPNNRS